MTCISTSPRGSVGIGTTAPAGMFSVGASSQFQVNASGDVTGVITTLNGSSTANGSGLRVDHAHRRLRTNFDIGNYVQVSSTNCVSGVNTCYAKITNKSSNTLTISPAITWANSSAVVEVHMPEIGGTDAGPDPREPLRPRIFHRRHRHRQRLDVLFRWRHHVRRQHHRVPGLRRHSRHHRLARRSPRTSPRRWSSAMRRRTARSRSKATLPRAATRARTRTSCSKWGTAPLPRP